MVQYIEFYAQNNCINPKTGEVIQKSELLPQVSNNEVLKKEIGKPIDSFDLFLVCVLLFNSIHKRVLHKIKKYWKGIMYSQVVKKKIYDDNEWIIGIPTAFESSKPFGQYTNW